MKNILTLLLAVFMLQACSVDEFNKKQPEMEGIFKTHMPVQDHLIGTYVAVLGQTNYKPGTIEITAERIIIAVEGYNYDLDITESNNEISTLTAPDCYFRIYLSNGDIIEINNWIVWGNEIRLMYNGVLIIRLIKITDLPEPVQPSEPEAPLEPEQPIKLS